ncbi:MAG: BrnA antitoxin family protein [Acidobacteria bacterium]|nr:BrnA antitoxin family protein [Acidobacteriota bacterium]
MGVTKRRAKTDWDRLKSLTGDEIRRAVAGDPDAPPIVDIAWMRRAKRVDPHVKRAISIRLDEDVINWFKASGSRYQTRINAILRAYVDSHR